MHLSLKVISHCEGYEFITQVSLAASTTKKAAATTIWRAHLPRRLEDPRTPAEAVTLMTEFLRVMLNAQKKIQSAAISQSRFVSIPSIGDIDGLGLARTRRGSPARLRANNYLREENE